MYLGKVHIYILCIAKSEKLFSYSRNNVNIGIF